MIRAGKLRKRIVIEQLLASDGTTNAFNESTTTAWTTYTTRWGSMEPLSGRELYQAQDVNPDVTHHARFRYVPGLTPKMRCRIGTRLFNIESAINIEERNREHVVVCKEQV